jgi:hypothetical protein
MAEGKYQNEIQDLPTLNKERYETLFKVYNASDTPNNFYFYNITKSIKLDTSNLDEFYFITYTVNKNTPWTTLAYQLYGSQFLWWFIKLLNPNTDIFIVKAGSKITVIKPEFLDQILNIIQAQIKV